MNEIWKPVVGYEGLYEVSNQGRVRSLDRSVIHKDGQMFVKGRILKPGKYRNRYYNVNLWKKGKMTNKTVHRLVAEAFIPNPDNKPCIDHINAVKTDNRIENLRWVTYSENRLNPITNEIHKFSHGNHPVAQYSLDGELIAVYPSISEAARQTGFNMTTIRFCCNGGRYRKGKWVNYKQCRGYVWKYFDV